MSNTRIEYQEASDVDVANYFVKGFQPKDGKRITNVDWFYDPTKGKFIFKLFVQSNQDNTPESCKE